MIQSTLFEQLPTANLRPRGKHHPYPRYARSESQWLGDLPAHWKTRRLKFIARSQPSNVDKKSVEGEMPVRLCNYVDVYKNDYITPDLDFMQATCDPSELTKFRLRRGDVLITKDSEEWNDIAVPAFVTQDFDDVACGYHLSQVRPRSDVMDGEYLFRAFRAGGVSEQFQVSANGVTRFGIAAGAIGDVIFPVPPIDEQRNIARFIRGETARIDRLIAEKTRLVELLAEKRAAVITHAVTQGLDPNVKMKPSGIEWLGEVPATWTHHKLGYVTTMRGGCTPSKAESAYWNGGVPWVSPKDMKRHTISDSEDHVTEFALAQTGLELLQPPVVLMVVRGMILAHSFPVAITTAPVTVNQDMKALRAKKVVDPEYLHLLLRGIKNVIRALVEESGHGTRVLRTELWKTFEVFLPDTTEQRRIVERDRERCDSLDRLVSAIETAVERLKEYRSALITAAVTGRIDVRTCAEFNPQQPPSPIGGE